MESKREKRMRALIKSMQSVLRLVSGIRTLKVYDLNPKDGIGCSVRKGGVGHIFVAVNAQLDALSDQQKEVVLYGVATHELLHLLRTDFEYAEAEILKYPPEERWIRHNFANIVEDAAIEYLRSDKLSDFLNNALTSSIGYFWKMAPALGNDKSPFMELMNALIQFGDVGVVKGQFKYKEAEKVFTECLSEYEQAITEPVFQKRYALSQQMFEKAKALWKAENDTRSFASELRKLIEKMGKGASPSGDGKPSDDGQEASGEAPESANERRKKTIHLIDKEKLEKEQAAADETSSENDEAPSDIYVAEGDDQDETSNADSSSGLNQKQEKDLLDALENDEYEIVDEREKKDESNSSTEEQNSSDQAASSSGSSEASSETKDEKEDENRSESGKATSESEEKTSEKDTGSDAKASTDSNSEPDCSDPEDNSGFNKPSSSQKVSSGDEDFAKENSSAENPSNENENSSSSGGNLDENSPEGKSESQSMPMDSNSDASLNQEDQAMDMAHEESDTPGDQNPAQDSGDFSEEAVPADNTVSKKDLGEELKDLSNELEEELESSGEFEISDELLEQTSKAVQDQMNKEAMLENREAKKAAMESIDVDVESPYYSGVAYMNRNMTAPSYSREYDEISARVRTLSINLRAAFKKAFQYKAGRKSYGNKGKVDKERYSGKKVTARLFYRKNMPDDKTDTAIVIFVDQSGSMTSHMTRAKETICVILDALKGFDVKVKVVGFTTAGWKPVYFHYGNNRWENTPDVVKSAMEMTASGGTFLGHALRYTGTMLKNRPESHKLYICITDGDPEDRVYANRDQGLKDCRQAINEVRRFADVIGVGVYRNEEDSNAFKYIFRENAITMTSLEGLVKELPRKIKKLFED